MAFAGDDDPPSGRSSVVGPDNVLDGSEDAVAELMKSLISQQGLNRAWQMLGKKLRIVEQRLQKALGFIAKAPEDYVPRPEYEKMQTHQTQTLEKHGERLDALDRLVADLELTVNKTHKSEIDALQVRVGSCEEKGMELDTRCETIDYRSQESCDKAIKEVKTLQTEITHHMSGGVVNVEQLQENISNSEDAMKQLMNNLETTLRQHTDHEIDRTFKELHTVYPDGSPYASKHLKPLLTLLGAKVVEPLKSDLSGVRQKVSELQNDIRLHRDEAMGQIRRCEKLGSDCQRQLKTHVQELKDDIGARAKSLDVTHIDYELKKALGNLMAEVEALQAKVSEKLTDFVGHFAKIHDVIDDHEHCVRHHAEEIENRGTKYDLLLCHGQIERCALKEEVHREILDIKKSLSWAQDKLGNMGLGAGGFGGSKNKLKTPKANRRRVRMGSMSSNASTLSTQNVSSGRTPRSKLPHRVESNASMYEASDGGDSPPAHESPTSRPESLAASPTFGGSEGTATERLRDKRRSGTAELQSLAEMTGVADNDGAASPSSRQNRDSLDKVHEAADMVRTTSDYDDNYEDYVDEGSEGDSDGEEQPSLTLLKMHIEAVAMAVVALAHLTLREAKVGDSRKFRIQQEHQLLQELQCMRIWITTRIPPAGWTGTRITSLALSFMDHNDRTQDNNIATKAEAKPKTLVETDKVAADKERRVQQWAQVLGGGAEKERRVRQALGGVAGKVEQQAIKRTLVEKSGRTVTGPFSARGPGGITTLPPLTTSLTATGLRDMAHASV